MEIIEREIDVDLGPLNIDIVPYEPAPIPERAFILANTQDSSLYEIARTHVIPVYIKDNEPVISHTDFIEITDRCVRELFHGETILQPVVRVSHPVKGRIPDAKEKPAKDLLEHEKTIYYERMAFTIEIATVQENVSGNALKLMVGGVKSYSQENLYSKKGGDEHFKVFIGFQNTVCTNMCVWSDGFVSDLKVKNLEQLQTAIMKLFYDYNMQEQISFLHSLDKYCLTETQFAQLIGRCRLYPHLSASQKSEIPFLNLSDTQINAVAKDYYRDESFARDDQGNINLWRLYNLFTGANKSSYIDTFLDRSVGATSFISDIKNAIAKKQSCWFLN